jgi:hypothetical protein
MCFAIGPCFAAALAAGACFGAQALLHSHDLGERCRFATVVTSLLLLIAFVPFPRSAMSIRRVWAWKICCAGALVDCCYAVCSVVVRFETRVLL